jgi:hypothetical protein
MVRRVFFSAEGVFHGVEGVFQCGGCFSTQALKNTSAAVETRPPSPAILCIILFPPPSTPPPMAPVLLHKDAIDLFKHSLASSAAAVEETFFDILGAYLDGKLVPSQIIQIIRDSNCTMQNDKLKCFINTLWLLSTQVYNERPRALRFPTSTTLPDFYINATYSHSIPTLESPLQSGNHFAHC